MARRGKRSLSAADADAMRRVFLRRRRSWTWTTLLLAAVAAGSSVCSRVRSPDDARPAGGTRVTVRRVIDGDTLLIFGPTFSGEERLRLRGIDAPELHRDGQPAAHFAEASREYLEKRIAAARDRSLILQFDGTETRDRFGRLLGFVYVTESDCLNLAMVRDGYAYADRRFDSFLKSELARAEVEARKRGRGLWKDVKSEDMPQWRQDWMRRRGIQN
jgi:micrococcal nuclease